MNTYLYTLFGSLRVEELGLQSHVTRNFNMTDGQWSFSFLPYNVILPSHGVCFTSMVYAHP